MREIERRTLAAAGLEVRAKGDDKAPMLVGYGAVFNSESEDLGNFREKIMPGAFDRALRENQEVLCRAEHDSGLLLGRRSNGTLRLSVDATGLRYEVDVPDTQAGRDTVTLTRRGDLCRSSFAFRIPDREGAETWTRAADGAALRELHDLDLVDVAPVADPAYRATTVSARALEQARGLGPAKKEERAAPPAQVRTAGLTAAAEKRGKSIEDFTLAIHCALYALLGDSWGPRWGVVETFIDAVIVQIGEDKFRYPIVVGADGDDVTFGPAEKVEVQYVPATGGESAAAGAEARSLELDRLILGID